MTAAKPGKPKIHRRRRGVIWVIGVMLVLSASLRLFDGTGSALAEAVTHSSDGVEPGTSAAAATCPDREEIAAILAAVAEREAKVTERDTRVSDRLQALQVAEAEITQRLAQLQSAEDSLKATLATASTAAETDVGNLTTVYESMKPREAAALFEQMPPDFAAGFLARMRPDAAAAIFAGLPPEAAYAISVAIAGRNAAAPSE